MSRKRGEFTGVPKKYIRFFFHFLDILFKLDMEVRLNEITFIFSFYISLQID